MATVTTVLVLLAVLAFTAALGTLREIEARLDNAELLAGDAQRRTH